MQPVVLYEMCVWVAGFSSCHAKGKVEILVSGLLWPVHPKVDGKDENWFSTVSVSWLHNSSPALSCRVTCLSSFFFFFLPAKFETDLFRKTDTVLLCFSLLLWVAGYWASMTKQLWLRSFHPSVLPSLKAEKYDLSLELYVWLKCQRLGSGKLGEKLLKTVLYPSSFFTMNKFLDTECVEGCLIKEWSSSLQLNSAFWARK